MNPGTTSGSLEELSLALCRLCAEPRLRWGREGRAVAHIAYMRIMQAAQPSTAQRSTAQLSTTQQLKSEQSTAHCITMQHSTAPAQSHFTLAFSADLGSGAASVLDKGGPPAPNCRASGGVALTLSRSYKLDPRGAGCWKKLAGLPSVLVIGRISV